MKQKKKKNYIWWRVWHLVGRIYIFEICMFSWNKKKYIWWRIWHLVGRIYEKVFKIWRSLKLCITSTWRDKRLAEHGSYIVINKCLQEPINIVGIWLGHCEDNILLYRFSDPVLATLWNNMSALNVILPNSFWFDLNDPLFTLSFE